MSWRWIDKQALLLLHGESLAEHGGGEGLRDEAVLDAALARPVRRQADSDPDIAALAASYARGVVNGHPFVDGNKRAAFLTVGMFLFLNGHRLNATQADAAVTLLALATGDLSETQFAAWLRAKVAVQPEKKHTCNG